MKDSITREVIIEHGISQVWDAITNSDEISSWFLKTDFKPEVGFKYTYESHDDDCAPIYGTVLTADPYILKYTWTVKGTGVETTVSWSLEEHESGTKLVLTHSGISNYDGDTAPKMFESFSGGWDNCIQGLTKYLGELAHV